MKNNETERVTHPAFAQLRFSRVQGSAKFYGSEIESNHYIQMELSTSEMSRELSKDWYFGEREQIVRLRMTNNQFSELITSMNYGSGSCCTLEYLNGKRLEDLQEVESRKSFVHRKFKDRMKEFSERLSPERSELIEKIKVSKLGKKDKEELLLLIGSIRTEIEQNIPFFAECFQETMDDIVQEAKAEIEAAISHKVTTAGLEFLRSDNLLNQNNEK